MSAVSLANEIVQSMTSNPLTVGDKVVITRPYGQLCGIVRALSETRVRVWFYDEANKSWRELWFDAPLVNRQDWTWRDEQSAPTTNDQDARGYAALIAEQLRLTIEAYGRALAEDRAEEANTNKITWKDEQQATREIRELLLTFLKQADSSQVGLKHANKFFGTKVEIA